MQIETAVLVGVLFGCGIWMMLQASFVRVAFGFILLSHAANLFLLAASGSPAGKSEPVVIGDPGPMVDPLPQALILTAIVIGFAMTAYLLVLFYRIFLDHRTTNARDLFAKIDREEEP